MKAENAKMDAAAEEARKDLPSHEHTMVVAEWIDKHYLTAGYKRLCRLLLEELE